jgi:hypothetical protein
LLAEAALALPARMPQADSVRAIAVSTSGAARNLSWLWARGVRFMPSQTKARRQPDEASLDGFTVMADVEKNEFCVEVSPAEHAALEGSPGPCYRPPALRVAR